MKSLKTLLFTLAFTLISTIAFSQIKNEWKERKDFHGVMSKTFHPAEEGNLQPIKTRSGEMVTKAEAWKNSAIPEDITNKKAVKKSLKKLLKGTKKLDKSVKSGATDAELTAQLTELHDVFHTIVGLCSAEDKHDEH